MATYPTSIPYSDQSDENVENGIQFDRGSSGAAWARSFFTGPKRTFKMVHPNISNADKGTLETFYNTNSALAVDLVWTDGVTYNCILGNWAFKPRKAARWDVQISLREK